MTSPEPHEGAPLRCFLCDHDLPETAADPRPDSFHAGWHSPQLRESFAASWDLAQIRDLINHARASYEVQGGCRQFTLHYTNTGVLFAHASVSGDSQPGNSVFVAHLACWKVVQHAGVSSDRLYEFASSTTPVALWTRISHAPISISEIAGAVNRETPLGGLLVDMAGRLPQELHREIMSEVELHVTSLQQHGKMNGEEFKALEDDPGVLFTRLATVQSSALPLLQRGFQEARRDVPGKESEKVHTMYIRTVELFGRSYISELGFNETADHPLSIPVHSEEVRGVRFALGRFGLRGLRILYADGSLSSWLGSTTECWFGNVEGGSPRDLEVVADGPRIVGIRIQKRPYRYPDIYDALLDREIDAPHDALLTFMSHPHDRRPSFPTPHYTADTWRHAGCLPLVFGSAYSFGLTMFWSKGTLRGMASFGPKNEIASVGLCEGEAVHFPLARGEYFTSLWMRRGYVQPPLVEPFLLTLGTSAGRSAHFGPQILLRPWMSSAMLRYRWEAISSWVGSTKITGLLVEALGEWNAAGYRRFGTVQEPLESSSNEWALARPTVLEIEVESPDPGDHFSYQETFRSTGLLNDVKGIQARRRAGRCVGMRIIHGAGLDDFLGSWDPADVPYISTIYDSAREAPLTTLLFHVRFKEDDLKPIILDVTTGNSADSYLENWKGAELMVMPVEEVGLVTDALLPTDFLVEFRCGQPENVIAWYHNEKTTEARSFTPEGETPIGRNYDVKGLCSLAWEPDVGRDSDEETDGRVGRS